MKNDNYENKLMNKVITTFAYIFKWLFLCIAVINSAFAITLLIVSFMYKSNLPESVLPELLANMTKYNVGEINHLFEVNGYLKVVTGGLAISLTKVINYILLYVLSSKALIIVKNIANNKIFSEENMINVNQAMPLAILLTLVQPVIVFVTSFSTNFYSLGDINIDGLGILMAVYIFKLLFDEGYKVKSANEKTTKELSKAKASKEEEKMESIKKTTKRKKTTKI